VLVKLNFTAAPVLVPHWKIFWLPPAKSTIGPPRKRSLHLCKKVGQLSIPLRRVGKLPL